MYSLPVVCERLPFNEPTQLPASASLLHQLNRFHCNDARIYFLPVVHERLPLHDRTQFLAGPQFPQERHHCHRVRRAQQTAQSERQAPAPRVREAVLHTQGSVTS
jgi:hypothetical protein